jgi:hypothetical protein
MARRATQRIAIAALIALAAGAVSAAAEPRPALHEAAHVALASLSSHSHHIAALLDGGGTD